VVGSNGDGVSLTILGGGPAGLAVGHYAHRAGLGFALYERSPELGGLCRTLECGAHRYDTGAHRFHDRDAEITRDVRTLLGDDLLAVAAPSQILDRGRFLAFPPSPFGWLIARGPAEAARVAADLVRSRWRPRPERTFEDYAVNRYGRRLGKPLLLDYSEKLWGLPAARLAPDVATRRLPGFTLASLLGDVLRPRRRSTHLDGSFLYPRRGYGEIMDRIVAGVPRVDLHTEHDVSALVCDGRRVRGVEFAARPPAPVAGPVVSTLPLTVLVRLLGTALPDVARHAAARLRFRHVRILFLRLARRRCSANATLYLPDSRLCVSRVTEPKNRSSAMSPAHETSLVAEVPCSSGDAVAALDDGTLAARVVAELARVGLVNPGEVMEWRHHLLPNAYPVYGLDYPDAVRTIRAALAPIENLQLLGRGGLFWYSHLHDQLRAAKDYVRLLADASRVPAAGEDIAAHRQIGEQAVVGAPAS
jgi:protoporphyrinogen oxidase